MSTDVTLRSLMGLPSSPAPLSESTLIMIDCQNTYRTGVMALEGVEPAVREAAQLLRQARQVGTRIVHVMHDAGTGSPYDLGAQIGQISDEVSPEEGEAVIVKNYPSSFFQTDLQEQLQRLGAQDLVLAGFMTHMCVNSTARDAFNLGFRPTIVADATATRDLQTHGQLVPAATVQQATLAGVADLFALVVTNMRGLTV